MHHKNWRTIPMLPCVSLDETLAFWQLLGYRVTYYQNRPYQYGVVEREGYQLHFYRIKGIEPLSNYSTCLVIVPDVYKVFLEFTQSLRKHLGRVSNSGLPRISRMKPDQTRFTLTDPAGNAIIFVNEGQKDDEAFEAVNDSGLTPLQKSVALAIRFRDFKIDFPAAAKVLDTGLKRIAGERSIDIAEALLIRGMLANEMNDLDTGDDCIAKLKNISLTKEEIGLLGKKLDDQAYIERIFAQED